MPRLNRRPSDPLSQQAASLRLEPLEARDVPSAPVVTSPSYPMAVNTASLQIDGIADADALVRVYADANGNGVIDGGDSVVGSQQLVGGQMAFDIGVTLAPNAANHYLVTSDAGSGEEGPTVVPTITQDGIAPVVVSVSGPAPGNYSVGQTIDLFVRFSDPVNVDTSGGTPRVTVKVGGPTPAYAYYVGGGGTSELQFRYTVQAGENAPDGVYFSPLIATSGGTLRDDAGNDADTTFSPPDATGVIVDTAAPGLVVSSPTMPFTNANPIPVTVTFTEAVWSFDAGDLVLGNATVRNFTRVSGSVYTFELVPNGDGAVTVQIGGGVAEDAAANRNATAAAFTRTFLSTRPTVSVTPAVVGSSVSGGNPVRFAVAFSRDVTGFDASDVVLGGTAGANRVTVTGSGSNYVVTVEGMTRDGSVTVCVADAAAGDAAGNTSLASDTTAARYVTFPPTIAASAGEAGGTRVRVFDPDGHERLSFTPFPGFAGAVSTAVADLNGDGVADVIVGAGAGGGPHVKVFDGVSGAEIRSFFAYDQGFRGGVSVAAGDVNGDGVADIVTGTGAGGGPHVKAFDGKTGGVLQSFFAYDPGFLGGLNLAVGDVNGDGLADIMTGTRAGGGPHVKVFDGATGATLRSFFAYDPGFTGGVTVAAGDVSGDGMADIVVGAGAGGGPNVRVFDGTNGQLTRSFFAYDPAFSGGVSVATSDGNGDGIADIVTGTGPGGGPHVKVFDGLTTSQLESFFAFDPYSLTGVNVG